MIDFFWSMVDIYYTLITSPFVHGLFFGWITMYFNIVTDLMENHGLDYYESIDVIDGRNTIIRLGDYNEVR